MKSTFLSFLLVLAIPSARAWFWDPPTIDASDPLEASGSFEVEKIPTEIELESATLMAEMFVPKSTPAAYYGMVLFMPGFGASFKMYEEYLNHLASHGYLTVGMDFESAGFTNESFQDVKAQQALGAIDVIRNMSPDYESLPVIVAGHSNGGKSKGFIKHFAKQLNIVVLT